MSYLHFWVCLLVEFVLLSVFVVVVHSIKVPLEISVRQLVGRLEFAIILMVLLHCIVGEVYKLVVQVFHIELLGSSYYVGTRAAQSVHLFFLNHLSNLFETLQHLYSIPPVRIFSRFHQPSIPFLGLKPVFELLSLLLLFFLLY